MIKIKDYSPINISATEHQIAQVHNLGILQKDIKTIVDTYAPYDTKHVAKLNSENAVITNNDIIKNYKPNISDEVKVGFYATDRYSQTDETDIVQLKLASENLDFLCNELVKVKADLKFAKDYVRNQFETDLHNKCVEIYGQMYEKCQLLQKQQDESLNRIRQAYKSQLADALAIVAKISQDQNMFVIRQTKIKEESRHENVSTRNKDLERKIILLEKNIEELNVKLHRALDSARLNQTETESFFNEIKEQKLKTVEETNSLKQQIARLEDIIAGKEEENDKLFEEMGNIQVDLERERVFNEQLSREFAELRAKTDEEKHILNREFEKQKLQIEYKLQDKAKESRVTLLNAAKRETIEHEREIERKRREFEEKEKRLREKLVLVEALQRQKEKEFELNAQRNRRNDLDMISKLRKNESKLKLEIERLKHQHEISNQSWEKRFNILKNSLHAIKDEMYVRQNLQKNSANLAYASVAYTMDNMKFDQNPSGDDLYVSSDRADLKPNKPKLPSINKNNNYDIQRKGSLSYERQYSFTISVPSRLSGHLEVEEDQIIKDTEMERIKNDLLKDVDFFTV